MNSLPMLLLILLQVNSLCAQADRSTHLFRLSGKITGDENAFIHLSYTGDKGKYIRDSCRILHGAFSFNGQVIEPTIAELSVNRRYRGDDSNNTQIYLEPGIMQVQLKENEFKQAKLTGSYSQKENEIYNHQADDLELSWKSMWDSLSKARAANDTTVLNTIYNERLPLYKKQNENLTRSFIKEYPSSYVSADLLFGQSFHTPVDTVESYYQALKPSIQSSRTGKRIETFISHEKNIAIGHAAPAFAATDATGKTISLPDYKGKFVLLDFWASWCEPCRAEHPFLKEAYTTYHQKGFEIIEVSLDKEGYEDEWKTAIAKDSLPWLQICDFKSWDNDIIKLYNVWGKGIPANFLIDPKGIIIDKNLRGDDVQKKLAGLIN